LPIDNSLIVPCSVRIQSTSTLVTSPPECRLYVLEWAVISTDDGSIIGELESKAYFEFVSEVT